MTGLSDEQVALLAAAVLQSGRVTGSMDARAVIINAHTFLDWLESVEKYDSK